MISNLNEYNKMKSIAQDELRKTSGGREYFDKIDSIIKLPKNIDIIIQLFIAIRKEQGENFNIILTGGFGDWILNLIKKGIIKIPGNVVLSNGSIRGTNNKLGKLTTGKEVDIIYKKGEIDNQTFILFDDSYYSGSTKVSLEKFLKKHNSSISKTYILYDGSDEKDKNRKSLYRYYDYHKGQKYPLEFLLNYLDSLDVDIPKESIKNKILKKQIETIQEVVDEVNKLNNKFKIDKLTHAETKQIVKRFENFEWDEDDFDFEEEIFNVDDVVKSMDGYIEYWSERDKKFLRIRKYNKWVIGEIEHASNIKSDSHGDIEDIPYDGYLVRGKHPGGRKYLVWGKMDNLVKV